MVVKHTLQFALDLPPYELAVVAHDAGASAHIASWLSSRTSPSKIYLEGPAVNQFKSCLFNSDYQALSLQDVVAGSSLVVTGTSWASDLEHRARIFAKERSIPIVAVLDHWCNFTNRFNWNCQQILPNSIWVSDAEAAVIARNTFPDIPVLQLPNRWLMDLSNRVGKLRSGIQRDQHSQLQPATRLLYLLEPIRVHWNMSHAANDEDMTQPGEFQGLRYWINKLPSLIDLGLVAPQEKIKSMVLRPHPSDPVCKYDAFVEEFASDWPITVDNSSGLPELLASADAAFGCETQALVAAMACGIPAYSSMPPWAPPCILPHPDLVHLRKL